MVKIAVIGAGASGCFAAAELGRLLPEARIVLYEAGKVPMAKLALTGGGRCNLSNTFESVGNLRDVYPRGARLMERLFHSFSPKETAEWFRREGIRLKVESGGRIFPESDDAMQVVRTLESILRRQGAEIRTGSPVRDISLLDADRILVATGGGALALLSPLSIATEPPVPSLFTFRTDDSALRALSGTTAQTVRLKIPGTQVEAEGPLLLTDWGFSGPAALTLSSRGARLLADRQYRSPLLVSWITDGEQQIRALLGQTAAEHSRKMVVNTPVGGLSERLWAHLALRSGLRPDTRWAEIGSKGFARLVATLSSDLHEITGRVRFKEEFVTCGGVSLPEVNPATLSCRKRPDIFFAGEVLDIDAVTGGFNLQAAWTTGRVAAQGIAKSLQEQ